MSIKYSRGPENISTISNLRSSKIYPNWDFWFENKPSGNPDSNGCEIGATPFCPSPKCRNLSSKNQLMWNLQSPTY
jgi:hypothetical protein